MIKITSLNKIYKSKKRKRCHALSDINLTLPDTGLVFVLGKSGSGKSTLLNLIGGLDNATSGSIEVDGNDLAKFREKDFCNYRNTHVGFIFQDYHLIDELTVYENIALALDLRQIKVADQVKHALEKVDLAGYEDRYPSELSGGEQQRVAIARAIVKKPRIILADEPTGNLDTNTARAIVTLLKELSWECLILIVSHNINDANNYADRIIELRKGAVISDKTRNPEFPDEVILTGEALLYPDGSSLSDGDIDLINGKKQVNLVKRKDKFLPTKEENRECRKVQIENKSLKFAKKMGLSGKFLKNKALAISLSSFMVAVIMIIMALAQTIIAFDGGEIVAEEMANSKQESIWLNKVASDETQKLLDRNYRVPVGENDVQALVDAGYKGDIYPVLNLAVPVTSMGASTYGTGEPYFNNSPYMTSTFGTMIVGEDFLTRKFGDYEYAARVDDFMPFGVIITDYVADSILMLNPKYADKTYENIVGAYFPPIFSRPRMYINGIIDTGYKDRYVALFDEIEGSGSFKLSDYYENEAFMAFMNEIYGCLGYSFATDANFVNAYNTSHLEYYPAHYKLGFNGFWDLTSVKLPYIANAAAQTMTTKTDNLLGDDWYYMNTPPEIPEGAKYIRVAFNNGCDKAFNLTDDISTREYALLQFDKDENIFQDLMNAVIGENKGAYINPYDGSITFDVRGANHSFVSEYIEIPEDASITEFISITNEGNAFCAFYDENLKFIRSEICHSGEMLPEASITMNVTYYNEIFGATYTDSDLDSFIPHKATLSHYRYDDVNNENPLFTKEISIVGLFGSRYSRTMIVSEDIWGLFLKDAIFEHSLYLDGTDGIEAVLELSDDLNYEHQSIAVEGIHTMTKAVDVFVPIFELIAVILCVGVVFILMNFSSKMINDKMHEIGILKALGTKNNSIGVVFGLQVTLIAILTCLLSTAGYYFFIDVANDVLIESLKRLAPSQVVLDLDFLTFKPVVALVNCVLVCALSLVSLVIPMIKIKAIKPVKIIKAKE